jgi:hypothetical protein
VVAASFQTPSPLDAITRKVYFPGPVRVEPAGACRRRASHDHGVEPVAKPHLLWDQKLGEV